MNGTKQLFYFFEMYGQNLAVVKQKYSNGRIAIELVMPDGESWCVASVNIPEMPVPEGHAFIKNWSEQQGLLEELVNHGIVSEPVSVVTNDFVNAPLCKVLI